MTLASQATLSAADRAHVESFAQSGRDFEAMPIAEVCAILRNAHAVIGEIENAKATFPLIEQIKANVLAPGLTALLQKPSASKLDLEWKVVVYNCDPVRYSEGDDTPDGTKLLRCIAQDMFRLYPARTPYYLEAGKQIIEAVEGVRPGLFLSDTMDRHQAAVAALMACASDDEMRRTILKRNEEYRLREVLLSRLMTTTDCQVLHEYLDHIRPYMPAGDMQDAVTARILAVYEYQKALAKEEAAPPTLEEIASKKFKPEVMYQPGRGFPVKEQKAHIANDAKLLKQFEGWRAFQILGKEQSDVFAEWTKDRRASKRLLSEMRALSLIADSLSHLFHQAVERLESAQARDTLAREAKATAPLRARKKTAQAFRKAA